jgi:hypothetical protein
MKLLYISLCRFLFYSNKDPSLSLILQLFFLFRIPNLFERDVHVFINLHDRAAHAHNHIRNRKKEREEDQH